MKRSRKFLFAIMIAMTIGVFSASAQIYVNVRPARPVVVRTEAPGPRHVWIDEDWRERGGRYEWAGGHWAQPPHPGYRYEPGRWDHNGHGHTWRQGRWHR